MSEQTNRDRAEGFLARAHLATPGKMDSLLRAAQVSATLAVADAITAFTAAQSQCDHGTVGFCPWCFRLVMEDIR